MHSLAGRWRPDMHDDRDDILSEYRHCRDSAHSELLSRLRHGAGVTALHAADVPVCGADPSAVEPVDTRRQFNGCGACHLVLLVRGANSRSRF